MHVHQPNEEAACSLKDVAFRVQQSIVMRAMSKVHWHSQSPLLIYGELMMLQ